MKRTTYILLFLAVCVGICLELRARSNEITVVNHSGGPIYIKATCFVGEHSTEKFVVADGESLDYDVSCPEGELTLTEPTAELENNKAKLEDE